MFFFFQFTVFLFVFFFFFQAEDGIRDFHVTGVQTCALPIFDARDVSATPEAYREYLAASRGELSIAKEAYVATRSGWFSTRSASYLATGRPVIVQDTGLSAHYPIGEAIVPFRDVDEAAAGLAAVEQKYGRRAAAERTRATLHDADLVVNLGGVNRVARARCPRAVFVYVDLDPAYTQLRLHERDLLLRAMVEAHDVHFTLGENIGAAGCRIPAAGIAWRPIRQPVVADLWTPLADVEGAAYTTIGKWDSAGRDLTLGDEVFTWRKRTEWFRFLDLPRRTGARFRVAADVASTPDDLRRLQDAGWEVVDPLPVSRDPDTYREFIRRSRGEFTVAKDVNIRLASGWFSDRSACYLAAGRPVVNQDTGFDRVLPTGAGLFSFRTMDDILAAFEAINSDYDRHCRAALDIAREYFDAGKVLGALLDAI